MCVCVCLRANTACVNEDVCMHFYPCAWVQLCVCVSTLVCVLIRRGLFFRRRKQPTVLSRRRPGLNLARSESGPSISVCPRVEARPCSQLFVQLAHQQGTPGTPTPPSQAQSDTSAAAPTQVTNLLTSLPGGGGSFAREAIV